MTVQERAADAALVLAAIALVTVTAHALIQQLRADQPDDGPDVASLPPLDRPPVGSRVAVHRQQETWFDCPPPPRRHVCWPQSGGWHHIFADSWFERCPCGAQRLDDGPWLLRNSYRSRKADPVVLPW